MNHPNPDEWMAYLYRELAPREQTRLDAHLRDCAECRRSVDSWRATLRSLDGWKTVPVRPARTYRVPQPLVQWAAAAAVFLFLGFGLGKLLGPPALSEELARAGIIEPLREQLRAEIRADILAALQSGEAKNPFQQELRTIFAAWGESQTEAARAEWATTFEETLAGLSLARAQDRQTTLGLLQQMRRDLETVAVVAQAQFLDTESRLGELVSFQRPASLPQ